MNVFLKCRKCEHQNRIDGVPASRVDLAMFRGSEEPVDCKILQANHYLSTHVGLVKEWCAQDAVAFSQLVDFTAVEQERCRRKSEGLVRPTYTAFILHSIARALCDHRKMNRIVYRSLTGYRWAQFEQVDIAVAVEVVQNDVDMAYASIIRNADQIGLEESTRRCLKLAAAPADDKQLKRLQMMPASLTAFLARVTGRHPKLWVRFRGGCCALTSPAKYGLEAVAVKSCWPLQFAFGLVADRPMVVVGRASRESRPISPCPGIAN